MRSKMQIKLEIHWGLLVEVFVSVPSSYVLLKLKKKFD